MKSIAVAGWTPRYGHRPGRDQKPSSAPAFHRRHRHVELNEAFAVQALACMDDLKIDWAKTNTRRRATAWATLWVPRRRITGKRPIAETRGKKFALSTSASAAARAYHHPGGG